MRRADEDRSTETDSPVSKTRRKRAMHELQDLGATLVALDDARLGLLDLPERLVDAITLARSITRHEARRRQLQYVGRLMREVDAAPIAAALARWAEGSHADKAEFAAIERWRDRLMADDAAIDDFVSAHAKADRSRLAALVREARRERAAGIAPHQFRALFRELRRLAQQAA